MQAVVYAEGTGLDVVSRVGTRLPTKHALRRNPQGYFSVLLIGVVQASLARACLSLALGPVLCAVGGPVRDEPVAGEAHSLRHPAPSRACALTKQGR